MIPPSSESSVGGGKGMVPSSCEESDWKNEWIRKRKDLKWKFLIKTRLKFFEFDN